MADANVKIIITASGDARPIDKITAALAALKGSGDDVAVSHEQAGKAAEDAGEKFGQTGDSANDAGDKTEESGKKAKDTELSFGKLARTLGVVAVAYKAVNIVMAAVGAGLTLNRTLETAETGIAAIIRQFDDTGNVKTFTEAQIKAAEAVEMLRIAAAKSPATFGQLAQAYQGTAGAMSQAGLSIRQQVDLVVLMSQSLAALGLRSDQILQESRALVTGNITANADAARMLGITKEQIDQAKEQGRLYDFLMEKLSAFAEAGENAAQSYDVSLSNMTESVEALEANITKPLFDALAKSFQELTATINDTNDAGSLQRFGVLMADVARFGMATIDFLIKLAPALSYIGWAAAVAGANMLIGRLITVATNAGGVTVAFTKLGIAFKGLFTGNPLGLILTTVIAIATAWWQVSAANRAALAEQEKISKETERMRNTFPTRLRELETEADRLSLLNDLQEKRNLLLEEERKGGLNSAQRERLRQINLEISGVQATGEAALHENRIRNAQRKREEAALRQVDANLKALNAPSTADQLADVQKRISALPTADLKSLEAERSMLLSERTQEQFLAEWQKEENARLRAEEADLRKWEQSVKSGFMSRGELQQRRDQLAKNATSRRQGAENATYGLPSDEQMNDLLRQNAFLIAQLKEKSDLQTKEIELQDELTRQRAELVNEEITGLDLTAQATRQSFQNRAMSAAQYREHMLAIIDEREKREKGLIEASIRDEALRTATLANLGTRYKQERQQVEDDIRKVALQRLDETWKAWEGYYRKRLEAIDDERQKLLVQATPESIEKANALWAARKKLIDEAAAKAKELNDAAAAAGIPSPIDPIDGEETDRYNTDNLPTVDESSAPDAETLAGAWQAYTAAARQAWTAGNAAFTGLNALTNGLARGIQGLIDGTMTLGQAFSAMGQMIIQAFIQMIAQAIAFAIVMTIVNALTGGAGSAFMGALGGIGTFMGGFAEGGYTGAGGKYEPAGVVHRGEYVLPADIVSNVGVARLDDFVDSLRSPLPGYDAGGFVNPIDTVAGQSTASNRDGNVSIGIIGMESEFRRWLESGNGRKILLDQTRRSRTELGVFG